MCKRTVFIPIQNTDKYRFIYQLVLKLSFLLGLEEDAQDEADDKNNVKSSNNKERVHLNKRATMSQQEAKTSDIEHNEITGEQKSHMSAVHEGEAKK